MTTIKATKIKLEVLKLEFYYYGELYAVKIARMVRIELFGAKSI